MPTGWFAGILTATFLAATAAFGGLAQAAVPPHPELEAGETHVNAQFALTVERAVLIDELPEAGITVEPGQRVLAVVLTAENVWDRALPSEGLSGLSAGVRIAELRDEPAAAIARFDDTTFSPYLQPRVPAELVLTWAVDRDALADGDEIEVVLRDLSLRRGELVIAGEYWETPVTAATMTLEVTDVGAGADAEGEEG
ncbi:hypothetical protein DT073_10115 [Microbacterium sp. ABRD28]|nr:hypothetical protein DT073_10115 [Microbacterium sp. ABRD28]